jgi:hypothetical protein
MIRCACCRRLHGIPAAKLRWYRPGHPRDQAAGQVGDQRHRVRYARGVCRPREQSGLVSRLEALLCLVIHHHQVIAERHHPATRMLTSGEVVPEQGQLTGTGPRQELLLDPQRRRPGAVHQQRVRVRDRRSQIQYAEQRAGDGVMDRRTGAGELAEPAGEVFAAGDHGRHPGLERRTDAVGADLLLGVAEAGRQVGAVQLLHQRRVRAGALQHQAVPVGQDDADGLVRQLVGQLAEHGCGTQCQGRRDVDGLVAGIQVVGVDP